MCLHATNFLVMTVQRLSVWVVVHAKEREDKNFVGLFHNLQYPIMMIVEMLISSILRTLSWRLETLKKL